MRRHLRIFILGVVAAGIVAAQGSHPEQGQEHAQAAVEHGEGHAEKTMPNEIWWKWANFAVLAAGLGFLISKNAGPFFKTRSAEIQKGIAEATAVRAEAEARAAQIERRLSDLDGEVNALRARSQEEQARELERVREETAQQMDKMQRQAEAEIAAAAKHASLDLKGHAAELALDLAARQVQARLTPQGHSELTSKFIQDLKGLETSKDKVVLN
jgi:F-type H+-transporting ATPase subunit b